MPTPSLPVETYRQRLKDTVADPFLLTVQDNPNTPQDEHYTKCNLFVRTVVRWFGFDAWKPPAIDGERAADIRNWMSAHPERWKPLVIPTGHPDFVAARDAACFGYLVVAAQVAQKPAVVDPTKWHASGHVCIVAPETVMVPSGSFGCKVPMVANVGGKKNEYGIGLSYAFRPDPPVGLWLYTGLG